jgi:sortase A
MHQWYLKTQPLLIIATLALLVNLPFTVPAKPTQAVTLSSPAVVKGAFLAENLVLRINKLSIQAPIIANVDGSDDKAYFQALENGVAHMINTLLPGAKGRTVIFGHSSKPSGYKGKFGQTFSRLNELTLGDEIIIANIKTEEAVVYRVSEKRLVDEKDVSVVRPMDSPILTLLTCWPIGTHDKRLAVIALLK